MVADEARSLADAASLLVSGRTPSRASSSFEQAVSVNAHDINPMAATARGAVRRMVFIGLKGGEGCSSEKKARAAFRRPERYHDGNVTD